jgi:hypothetical protein
METDSPLEQLAQACAGADGGQSDLDAIQKGRSVLIKGHAVAAQAGTFALATETGIQIIVNRDDVLSVERDAKQFIVELKAGTEVIARLEQVIKADASCECYGSASAPASIARIANQGTTDSDGCNWELRFICRVIPTSDGFRYICLPVPVRTCIPPIVVGPPPA